MKRILCFGLVFLLCGGCDNDPIVGTEPEILMVSYIPVYEYGPFNVEQYSDASDVLHGWFGETGIHKGGNIIMAPELGSKGSEAKRFLEIAERNGDRSYNRYETIYQYSSRSCYIDNFKEVHIKCTNAAWDNLHPAGSSLDDLFEIEYSSYGEYVRKGYPVDFTPLQTYRKTLLELTEDDMFMIFPDFHLYADNIPTSGKQEIQVTLVTTDGEEKTALCTLQ